MQQKPKYKTTCAVGASRTRGGRGASDHLPRCRRAGVAHNQRHRTVPPRTPGGQVSLSQRLPWSSPPPGRWLSAPPARGRKDVALSAPSPFWRRGGRSLSAFPPTSHPPSNTKRCSVFNLPGNVSRNYGRWVSGPTYSGPTYWGPDQLTHSQVWVGGKRKPSEDEHALEPKWRQTYVARRPPRAC